MKRDPAWGEPHKRLTRMDYTSGPAGYLQCQIMKSMQRVCYPAVFLNGTHVENGIMIFRHEKHDDFTSKDAPDGAQFWDTLGDCVEVINEKHDTCVTPVSGLAGVYMIPIEGDLPKYLTPTQRLEQWFLEAIPSVWKAHVAAEKQKELRALERAK